MFNNVADEPSRLWRSDKCVAEPSARLSLAFETCSGGRTCDTALVS